MILRLHGGKWDGAELVCFWAPESISVSPDGVPQTLLMGEEALKHARPAEPGAFPGWEFYRLAACHPEGADYDHDPR